jgi:Domain of unknown function (DUF4326)
MESWMRGNSHVQFGEGDGENLIAQTMNGVPVPTQQIGRDGVREETLVKYRRWLWEQINLKNEVYLELKRIAELATHGDIALLCWCVPKPCHAAIVKRAEVNPSVRQKVKLYTR